MILTDQPLKNVLQKVDASGRLLKWVVELSKYGIELETRQAIKAQALADFFAETNGSKVLPSLPSGVWSLYMDNSSTKEGSGTGLIIEIPPGQRHEHTLKFMFRASTNEVDYEVLIASLELCHSSGAEAIRAYLDSQLVLSQLNREYKVKDNTMVAYVRHVQEATARLSYSKIIHILRSKNHKVDAQSKLASSSSDGKSESIQWETLLKRSTESREIMWLDRNATSMEPITAYLSIGMLPLDAKEA